MRHVMRALPLLAGVALCLAVPQVPAAGIRISPVRLQVAPDARTTSVRLSNEETQSRRFQVQIRAWTQAADGSDQFADAPELVANPPLFEVQPEQTRVVRIGFLDAVAPTVEACYRVFIREVPESTVAPDGRSPAVGIRILRRFSLPLCRQPAGDIRRDLRWDARVVDGQLELTAHNRGNVHERRAHLRIFSEPDHTLLGTFDGPNDVLAGSSRTWNLDKPIKPGVRLQLDARSDRQNAATQESVTVR